MYENRHLLKKTVFEEFGLDVWFLGDFLILLFLWLGRRGCKH